MRFPRFVVTHVDVNANRAHVRQTTSPELGSTLLLQPISLEFKYVAEVFFYEGATVLSGYRLPSDSLRSRTPQVGDEIMGVIAHDFDLELMRVSNEVAYDDHGLPFLRNWMYVDQHDQAKLNPEQREDYDYDDQYEDKDEDDYDPDDQYEDDPRHEENYDDGYVDEDPLAGDTEPTGGYYTPPINPFEAQRLSVMRQHGDYTSLWP